LTDSRRIQNLPRLLPSPSDVPDHLRHIVEDLELLIAKLMIKTIEDTSPVCEKHDVKMVPVRWSINADGVIEGTEWLCQLCRDEAVKNNKPIMLILGPKVPLSWEA